jgi:hypothetical protein
MTTSTPDQPDTPAPQPPPALIRLEDAYEFALVGITVSPSARPRFVYSLTRLLRHEKFLTAESDTSARLSVFNMVRDIERLHGDAAPVFVDDAVSTPEPPRVFTPTIITP